MQIIVGSTALKWFGLSPREPKDTDIWTDKDYKLVIPKHTEMHIIPWNILSCIPTCEYDSYATPDAIYTIKCSHAAWDIHWNKTIADILYLKQHGCKLIPELHARLYEYWKTEHGNKDFLSLNRSKDAFFNDYIKKEYDHDLLHEIVSENGVPVYTTVLKDGQEVLIDKNKFNKLSKEQQIRLFREEIYVIALERYLIPTKFKMAKSKAYYLALKKTITNLTKGWATHFIIDNIDEYVKMCGKQDSLNPINLSLPNSSTTWVNNFYKHIGKEIVMHPIIQKIKDKAEELELDSVENALVHGDWNDSAPDINTSWYKDDKRYFEQATKEYNFGQFLKSLGYKTIETEGGEDQGTSAHTVIEIEGVLFRMDYSYYSYDGYNIDDVWDWHEVKPIQKTVTVYE